jgi:hypothetical protein
MKIAGEMSDARHFWAPLYSMEAIAPNSERWDATRGFSAKRGNHHSPHGLPGTVGIGSCLGPRKTDKEREKRLIREE